MSEKKKPYLYDLPKVGSDDIGYLSIAEINKNIPFEIKRVYWTYSTPDHISRGAHAHRKLQQVIIAVSGSIEFYLEDNANNNYNFVLNQPDKALFIPPGHWREIKFKDGAVLLCLASAEYDEEDYIRNYDEFLKWQK